MRLLQEPESVRWTDGKDNGLTVGSEIGGLDISKNNLNLFAGELMVTSQFGDGDSVRSQSLREISYHFLYQRSAERAKNFF